MSADPRRQSDAVEGGRLLILLLLVASGVTLQLFSISRPAEATGYVPHARNARNAGNARTVRIERPEGAPRDPGRSAPGPATWNSEASSFEQLGGRRGLALPPGRPQRPARVPAPAPAQPFARMRPARLTSTTGLEPAASSSKRPDVGLARTPPGTGPAPPPDSIVAPNSPAQDRRIEPGETTQHDLAGPQLLILGPAVALRGDEVVYSIMVENVGRLSQAALELVFDPDVLEFLEATEGPFLASGDTGAQIQVRESSSPGTLLITIARPHPTGSDPGEGHSKGSGSTPTSGLLCVVRLLAKGEGESGIRLTGSRLLDSAGQEARISLNGIRVAVQP